MPISVSCPECGKGLKAPDALAGKKAKCPGCGAVVPIPMAVVDAEVVDDEPPPLPSKSKTSPKRPAPVEDEYDDPFDDLDDGEANVSGGSTEKRKPCPMCGEMILAAAAKCRFCGENFDARVTRSGRRRRSETDEYAGFWMRFVAAFVDGFIIGIVMLIAIMILGGILIAIEGPPNGNGNEIGPGQVIFLILYYGISIAFPWLYSAFQESSESQATLGKRMMGIRVTDLEGNRISFGRASGRHFGKILSHFVCAIGYIMAAFTEKKQALHDMMASTLVVRN